MPHWTAIIDTSSSAILRPCRGDPVQVRKKLMEASPQGANLRGVSFESGQDVARITVEGPNSDSFLRQLEARDVVELVTAHERSDQKRG